MLQVTPRVPPTCTTWRGSIQHPMLYKHVFVYFDQYSKFHHEYHQHVQQRPSSRYLTCGSPDPHWTRPFGRRHWRSQTRIFFRPTLFRSVSTTVGCPSWSDSPPDTVKETSESSGHVSQPYQKKDGRGMNATPHVVDVFVYFDQCSKPVNHTRKR